MITTAPPRFNKLLGFAGVILLATSSVVRAAEPASGTTSDEGDKLAWQGGPFTSANASTGTCVEGTTCDTFTLSLAIPEGKVAKVNFEIHWQGSTNDFDLFVFDERGSERGNSADGFTELEQVAIEGLPAGTYEVVTNTFATVDAAYEGMITLQDIDEPPPQEELTLSETLRFDDETIVDFGSGSGEPFIRSDNEGNIFDTVPFGLSTTVSLLWKSIDGGRSYIPLGTPIVRDSVVGMGGDDIFPGTRRNISRRVYHDMFAERQFGEDVTVTLSVDNITDADPPFFATAAVANTDVATYRLLGTTAWARVSLRAL